MTPEEELLAIAPNGILFAATLIAAVLAWASPGPTLRPRTPDEPSFRLDTSWLNALLVLWFSALVVLLSYWIPAGILKPLAETGKPPETAVLVIGTLLMQGGLFAVVRVAFRDHPGGLRALLGLGCPRPWTRGFVAFLRILPLVWLTALFWGAILSLLVAIGVPLDLVPQEAAELIAGASNPFLLVILGLSVTLLAPVVEEIFFRGFLYRFLSGKIGIRASMILTGVFFAFLHGNLQSFLPLAFFGLFLAAIYEDTRDIRVPIMVHAVFNANAFVHILLLPQGLTP